MQYRRFVTFVLFVLATCGTSYAADDHVWIGPPSRQILRGPDMLPGPYCHPTIRRQGGKLIYHPVECPETARNHLDIGVPLYGSPINETGVYEATQIIKKGRWIYLN